MAKAKSLPCRTDPERTRIYVCSSCRARCRSWVWQALGIEGAVESKCPACCRWCLFVSGGWLEEAEEKAA